MATAGGEEDRRTVSRRARSAAPEPRGTFLPSPFVRPIHAAMAPYATRTASSRCARHRPHRRKSLAWCSPTNLASVRCNRPRPRVRSRAFATPCSPITPESRDADQSLESYRPRRRREDIEVRSLRARTTPRARPQPRAARSTSPRPDARRDGRRAARARRHGRRRRRRRRQRRRRRAPLSGERRRPPRRPRNGGRAIATVRRRCDGRARGRRRARRLGDASPLLIVLPLSATRTSPRACGRSRRSTTPPLRADGADGCRRDLVFVQSRARGRARRSTPRAALREIRGGGGDDDDAAARRATCRDRAGRDSCRERRIRAPGRRHLVDPDRRVGRVPAPAAAALQRQLLQRSATCGGGSCRCAARPTRPAPSPSSAPRGRRPSGTASSRACRRVLTPRSRLVMYTRSEPIPP